MTKAEAFARLGKSKFRSRFRLTAADRAYVERVGMETVRRHAGDFVRTKFAPSDPEKDGRQTPMRGHPVFKALSLAADAPVGLFDVNNNCGTAKDKVIFFQCSAIPAEMVKGKGKIGEHLMFKKSFGPGTGVGIFGGSMKPMPLTVGSMKTEDGRPWAFVTSGKATDEKLEKAFFGVGFVFKKDDGDANGLLNYMARNGYRHHVAFEKGDWSAAIAEAFSNYLGYEIETV